MRPLAFALCEVVLLLLSVLPTNAWEVIRSQAELEMARARHHDVPLWGIVFDDAHAESIQFVKEPEPHDPREGAALPMHAATVDEFARERPGTKVALNALAREGWNSRKLTASSYVRIAEFSVQEAERAVVLVHWAGEKQLARARFAAISEARNPGVPYADACLNTKNKRERALVDRLPVHPHEHTLVFFAKGKVACFAHFYSVKEMEEKYEKCHSVETR
jgi:hypothetical protein